MSGLPPLRGMTKSCCALWLRRRGQLVKAGRALDLDWFGCPWCGAHYKRSPGPNWDPVTALEALRGMVEDDSRGTLEIEQ